jgi:hypothetical protein
MICSEHILQVHLGSFSSEMRVSAGYLMLTAARYHVGIRSSLHRFGMVIHPNSSLKVLRDVLVNSYLQQKEVMIDTVHIQAFQFLHRI